MLRHNNIDRHGYAFEESSLDYWGALSYALGRAHENVCFVRDCKTDVLHHLNILCESYRTQIEEDVREGHLLRAVNVTLSKDSASRRSVVASEICTSLLDIGSPTDAVISHSYHGVGCIKLRFLGKLTDRSKSLVQNVFKNHYVKFLCAMLEAFQRHEKASSFSNDDAAIECAMKTISLLFVSAATGKHDPMIIYDCDTCVEHDNPAIRCERKNFVKNVRSANALAFENTYEDGFVRYESTTYLHFRTKYTESFLESMCERLLHLHTDAHNVEGDVDTKDDNDKDKDKDKDKDDTMFLQKKTKSEEMLLEENETNVMTTGEKVISGLCLFTIGSYFIANGII